MFCECLGNKKTVKTKKERQMMNSLGNKSGSEDEIGTTVDSGFYLLKDMKKGHLCSIWAWLCGH